MAVVPSHHALLTVLTQGASAQQPGTYANAALVVQPRHAVLAPALSLGGQKKAPLEQIKARTATHLALERLHTMDVALHRAMTPGQSHTGADRVIVVAQPFREPLQGRQRTLRRPRQPGVQLCWLPLAHALGIAGNGDIPAGVTTLLELSEVSQGVAALRVPAFKEIGGRGREETAAAVTAQLALGNRGGPQRAKHRILGDSELCRDRMPWPSLAVQGPNLLIERQPLGPLLVYELLGYVRRRRRRHPDGLQHMVMGIEHLVEGFGEVLPQVKAIGDLDRIGGALLGSVRRGSGSISSDHADAGMCLPPQGYGLGLTIGPEGERSMSLKINPDGPIGLTFPNGPVVDAEHLGCRNVREGQTTPQAREGVATDGEA